MVGLPRAPFDKLKCGESIFPNMVVMAPGDAHDLEGMLEFSLQHDAPCSLRYPKTKASRIEGSRSPIELGAAEIIEWGEDGVILCAGTQLDACLEARRLLANQDLDVGVVNARFVKPIDREVVTRALRECPFVVTVEENALMGGFGSAVLEVAADEGMDASHVKRLGIPDQFVEHGDRSELLEMLRLDAHGIAETCREMTGQLQV